MFVHLNRAFCFIGLAEVNNPSSSILNVCVCFLFSFAERLIYNTSYPQYKIPNILSNICELPFMLSVGIPPLVILKLARKIASNSIKIACMIFVLLPM